MKSLYLFIFCLLMSIDTFSQKEKNDTLPLSKQGLLHDIEMI